MPEVDEIEPNSKLDKAKEVIKNHWKPFTVGVVLTLVTVVVTKRLTMRHMMHIEGTTTIIHKAVLKDGGTLYKVINIYAPGFKNQGPSWMVKCVETGKLFRSQEHAAKVMKLSKDHISNHLNGGRTHVSGYHFERMGIAT